MQLIKRLTSLRSDYAAEIIINEMRDLFGAEYYGSIGNSGLWMRQIFALRDCLFELGEQAKLPLARHINDKDDGGARMLSFELARLHGRLNSLGDGSILVTNSSMVSWLKDISSGVNQSPELRRAAERGLELIGAEAAPSSR